MNTIKKSVPFLLAAFLLLQGMTASAQEEKTSKVHLKVMTNDEVTVDTTFQIATGADSDELKKMIQEITGIEDLDLHVYHTGELHAHSMLMKKHGSDSLKTVALVVSSDDELKDLEIIKEDGVAWVSKEGTGESKIIVKSGKGDEHVYAIISGDEKDIKIIGDKANVVKVIHEGDLEEGMEEKAGAYVVVKEKTDLDDVEEIVIKKKDGNVIIMKGDEIQSIKGKGVYIKSSDDAESFDIFLKNGEDGTVVVKKDVKVIKKENDEGEEEIEIIIMEKDTSKAKVEIKEKKAEKKEKK